LVYTCIHYIVVHAYSFLEISYCTCPVQDLEYNSTGNTLNVPTSYNSYSLNIYVRIIDLQYLK